MILPFPPFFDTITPKGVCTVNDMEISCFLSVARTGSYTIGPASSITQGLHKWQRPGPGLRLVFVTAQGRVSPWVSLFESYVRQRRLGV